MQTRRVNVNGEGYECARRYMIRLERRDFESAQRLARLSAAAGMTPEQFRKRFESLVASQA
jgi:6-phosphofructokinase 1